MKKCIWCQKTENKVTFIKLAHTIPKSLGGKLMCENVCDECNAMFGKHDSGLPPVEVVLKEILNIARVTMLSAVNEVGKNKALDKPKSEYFNINLKQKSINAKPRFVFSKNFLDNIFRQFKRGIYKIYLEELERQTQTASDVQFDFIRQFARFNKGNPPLYYFNRKYGVIYMTIEAVKTPMLHFDEDHRYKYLYQDRNFYEFELLGHVFGLATSSLSEILEEEYVQNSLKLKKNIFNNCVRTSAISDIDVFHKFMK